MDGVTPDLLVGFPGAPFTEGEIEIAVEAMRNALGWHVFPERDDTAVLDTVAGDDTLRLPTRRLVSVESVRDTERTEPYPSSRYRVSRAFGRIRSRGSAWPGGFERVEVRFRHGFPQCPADLLPVVAQSIRTSRTDPTVQSIRVDDASVSYLTAGTSTLGAQSIAGVEALRRYALPQWPGMA